MVSCGIGHPPFDSNTPDTKNNVFHYEHLVNIKISNDVKSLYSYGNEFGIDASYYLSFKCSKQTSNKIIKQNEMTLDVERGTALYSSLELIWWNRNEIDTLKRYVYSNPEKTYFKYFWYNKNTNQGLSLIHI